MSSILRGLCCLSPRGDGWMMLHFVFLVSVLSGLVLFSFLPSPYPRCFTCLLGVASFYRLLVREAFDFFFLLFSFLAIFICPFLLSLVSLPFVTCLGRIQSSLLAFLLPYSLSSFHRSWSLSWYGLPCCYAFFPLLFSLPFVFASPTAIIKPCHSKPIHASQPISA